MSADVLLDARLTRQMSVGMKAYARELARRLPLVAPDLSFAQVARGRNFGLGEQVGLPLLALRRRARVVHHLSVYAALAMPGRVVITVHDLIHLRFPEYFSAKVRPYYLTVVRAACARAARVVTDDPRTVDDLERYLGVPPYKTRVIPLGVDDFFLRDDLGCERADRPYVVYAGNHRPHKDLATLVRAWREIAARTPLDLVLTGADDLAIDLARSAPHGRVRFVGDVDLARLAALYRGAAALVHPALCEGFGLPMLEAAAVGTRVIACADAVPAALRAHMAVFPARDVAALRAEIEAALGDAGAAAGAVRRAEFVARTLTWDACARATADVYRELLEEPDR